MQKKSNRKIIPLLFTLFLFLLPALSVLTTFIPHNEETYKTNAQVESQVFLDEQNQLSKVGKRLDNINNGLIPLINLSSVKENSINEIIETVNDLNPNDYSTANWQEINKLKLTYITNINNASTIDDVNAFLIAGLAAINNVLTLEELDANDELNSLIKDDSSDDVKNIIIKAITAINKATTLEAVADLLTTANNDVDTKVKEELAAVQALQAAKDAAKLELDNYVKNPSIDVQTIITTAKKAIDSSLTIEEVTNLLTNVKLAIDIKVAEELAAVALQAAKDAALDAINDKVDGLNKSDYSQENWANILAEQAKAIAAINRAKTIEDVGVAKDAGLSAIEAVKTLAQIAAEELQAAKDNAMLEIDAYLAQIDSVSDYLMNIITQAQTAIENAKTISSLDPILSKLKADIQTRYNFEVSEAKKDALNAINGLIGSLDEDEYSRKNWRSILDANDALIRALDIATKLSEVNAANKLAENNIKKVLTIEQEIIKTARDSAKGSLDAYLDRIINPSNDVRTIVKEAKAAIDKETNPEIIAEIAAATLKALDEKIADELIEAKALAIEEIATYIAGLNKEDYTQKEWSKVLTIQKDYAAKIERARTADKVEKVKISGIKKINEVLNPGPVCLWWLIMSLSFIIIIEIVAIVNKKILDKQAKKQITAFALPILAIPPVFIPSNAWLIISLELLTIVILFAYIIYLYRFNLKNIFTPKKKVEENQLENNEKIDNEAN